MSEAGPTAEGQPVDFEFELGDREIAFEIDEDLYPRDAVYGASYTFVDRVYVFLQRPADRRVRVRLRTRKATDEQALEALAGEFANELLNQVLRLRIGQSTAKIREYYMARAFFADRPSATVDELLAELDQEELAEDPLEISVPWAKDSPEPAASTASEAESEDQAPTA